MADNKASLRIKRNDGENDNGDDDDDDDDDDDNDAKSGSDLPHSPATQIQLCIRFPPPHTSTCALELQSFAFKIQRTST